MASRATGAGIGALLGSLLLLFCFASSWYTVSLSTTSGSQRVEVDLYPGQTLTMSATSGSSTTTSTTTYSEAKLGQTGTLYAWLGVMLIFGAVFGVAGASALLAAGTDRPSAKSWGTAMIVLALLLALVGPLMMLVSQPSALANDSYKGTLGSSSTNGPTSTFFGSNSSGPFTATWGPSWGWYLSFVAFVLFCASVAAIPRGRREEVVVSSRPVVVFAPPPNAVYSSYPNTVYGQPEHPAQGDYPPDGVPSAATSPPPYTPQPSPSAIPGPPAPSIPPPPPGPPPERFCTACGSANYRVSAFCQRCGRPLGPAP